MNTPMPGWVVVIPAKPLATAKSRLADAAGSRRPDLALAMLLDTVEAALRARDVAAVLVVTDDDLIAASAAKLGAITVPDVPRAGLNDAFAHGIAVAVAKHPGAGVVLLAGDLPALQARELETVLVLAAESPGAVAVADRDGIGTTVLAAHSPAQLRPAFGGESFARHRTLDASPVDLDGLDGLRCDVDNAVGLHVAIGLGVGIRTAAVLAAGPETFSPRDTGPGHDEGLGS